MGRRSVTALLVAAGSALVVALWVSDVGRLLIVWTVIAAITVVLLVTVVAGVAITAVVRPLEPVSEQSILGRRATGFAKFALAVAAVFGTAFIAWFVGERLSDVVTQAHAMDAAFQLLGISVMIAGMVFWMWLSVDLLRLGRRRRAKAVGVLARTIGRHIPGGPETAKAVAWTAVAGSGRILVAFYLAPILVVTGVTWAVGSLAR